jgi:hypothetical protein
MTYDFFVVPADLAEDLEQALGVYEATPETGALTPGGPVASFLSALAPLGAVGVRARGSDAGAYVTTSWDDPMGNLRSVAEAAAARGLSVLDVQLGVLYDPRDRLDVALETQGGPRLTFVTRRILRLVLSHVRAGRYHWVTLSRAPDVFVQTYRDDDGSWALEHREGRGRHFAARTTDPVLVEQVLWSWARNDGRWQAQVAFSPIHV